MCNFSLPKIEYELFINSSLYMRSFLLLSIVLALNFSLSYSTPITGINAISKNGQVFITWNNLAATDVEYIVYRSATPIKYGYQLTTAQNLGFVADSSSLNKRYSLIKGVPTYLKIDSASSPLSSTTGLFVATSTTTGSFYYAVVTSIDNVADTTIINGINSLSTPVTESVTTPHPVWQQEVQEGVNLVQVYVQYVTSITSPLYPQMTNRGSFPFNFAVYKPTTGSAPYPLELRLHGGGGNFLEVMGAPFDVGTYGLGTDDWLPSTFMFSSAWFGYNENYNIYSIGNHIPDTGINNSYTLYRIAYTINWVETHYPIDTTRFYIIGTSMGGSGCMWLSMYMPGKIAAVSEVVPKFDLAFLNDPNPHSQFNLGTHDRDGLDTLWGTVATNLPCDIGYGTYNFLNAGYMLNANRNNSLPLIFAQSGKKDTLTGWAEKILYYDSVNTNMAGGCYFWDMRGHDGSGYYWEFAPNLLRYSTSLSFPAFSNCSTNNSPGNGLISSGDSIGTINGFLDWNDAINDQPNQWDINLLINSLESVNGIVHSPDSCSVDVTLRRLQKFKVPIGDSIDWIDFASNGTTVIKRGGYIYTGGLITIPTVKVYKGGINLKVYNPAYVEGISSLSSLNYSINTFPNPTCGNVEVELQLKQPVNHLNIQLVNLLGQIVRTWYYSAPNTTLTTLYNLSDLPKGAYFLQFTGDNFTTTKKLILQ